MDKKFLSRLLNAEIKQILPVLGADISETKKVTTENGTYFVKSASFSIAEQLFKKEVFGLKKLASPKLLGIPKIVEFGNYNERFFLVLEFIETKTPNATDMSIFGRKLAQLHLSTSTDTFGLEHDNFIGKLHQKNTFSNSWVNFFVENRLGVQVKLAVENRLLEYKDVPSLESMEKVIFNFVGPVKASLLHGDLWSGNYLFSTNGQAFLIDPSVYYGHNEVDLAMSKLFGGFAPSFYNGYHEIITPHLNQKELTEIYQLYYLLVHLNLFGPSYHKSVINLLRKYF